MLKYVLCHAGEEGQLDKLGFKAILQAKFKQAKKATITGTQFFLVLTTKCLLSLFIRQLKATF